MAFFCCIHHRRAQQFDQFSCCCFFGEQSVDDHRIIKKSTTKWKRREEGKELKKKYEIFVMNRPTHLPAEFAYICWLLNEKKIFSSSLIVSFILFLCAQQVFLSSHESKVRTMFLFSRTRNSTGWRIEIRRLPERK